MKAEYRKTGYFIFDLDGTLADTLDDITYAMNSAFGILSLPPVDRARVHASINNGARMLVMRCLPEDMRGDEEAVSRALGVYDEEYRKYYSMSTRPFPEAKKGLEILRRAGARVGVVSNKQDPMVGGLVGKLFPGLVDFSLGTGAGFPPKPSPEGALHIAKELGAPSPDRVTFIGDSDVDMTLSLAAGMQPVGVGWGYRPPEALTENGALMILNTPEDFLKLI
ncbi:MAG: HAD family hydrolase [Clostridia bacterium]|nr:HAD family hydrolase [Clostridia bacterium]